jgi:iron complex outermembrane receptor protein
MVLSDIMLRCNSYGTENNAYNGARPNGSQVFPGFRPANAIDKDRNRYIPILELDVTDKWLINGALRFENYSDFGNTTNF